MRDSITLENRYLGGLLQKMIDASASDLYLVGAAVPMFRVEGMVSPAGDKVLFPEQLQELARSIMSDSQWERFTRTCEMNLGLPIDTSPAARFRVNVYRQRDSLALVIRRVDVRTPTIDELRLPPILKDLAGASRGLVLVVGAAGAGKSTTLAAMVNHRNECMQGHIITIEDPIEFLHAHKMSIVSQREIGFDTRSYRAALKNALRQAPDVLLIGEIRDRETMEVALAVADTGHLCLGTLHSANTNQTFERVMNFFPESRHKEILLQLSLNLRAIVCERLVLGIDGRRLAAFEVMLDTPRIRELIKKGEISTIHEAMAQGTLEGCRLFDDDLFRLYKQGNISAETALATADSHNNIRLRIMTREVGGGNGGYGVIDPRLLNDDGERLRIQDEAA